MGMMCVIGAIYVLVASQGNLDTDVHFPVRAAFLWDITPNSGRLAVIYSCLVIFGWAMLYGGWEAIFALPRIIVDDEGVGGRFVGGGFVGVKRIAWDDIVRARLYQIESSSQYATHVRKYLVLDVNNADGKYRPARKYWSAMARRDANLKYAFYISKAKLSDKQAREIAEVIIRNARGKRD